MRIPQRCPVLFHSCRQDYHCSSTYTSVTSYTLSIAKGKKTFQKNRNSEHDCLKCLFFPITRRYLLHTCVSLGGQDPHLRGVVEHGQGAVRRAARHGVVVVGGSGAPVVALAAGGGERAAGAGGGSFHLAPCVHADHGEEEEKLGRIHWWRGGGGE